jgi:hypothetical protein
MVMSNVFSFENFKFKQFAVDFVDVFSKSGPEGAVDYAVQNGYTDEDFVEMFAILRAEFARRGYYKVMGGEDETIKSKV